MARRRRAPARSVEAGPDRAVDAAFLGTASLGLRHARRDLLPVVHERPRASESVREITALTATSAARPRRSEARRVVSPQLQPVGHAGRVARLVDEREPELLEEGRVVRAVRRPEHRAAVLAGNDADRRALPGDERPRRHSGDELPVQAEVELVRLVVVREEARDVQAVHVVRAGRAIARVRPVREGAEADEPEEARAVLEHVVEHARRLRPSRTEHARRERVRHHEVPVAPGPRVGQRVVRVLGAGEQRVGTNTSRRQRIHEVGRLRSRLEPRGYANGLATENGADRPHQNREPVRRLRLREEAVDPRVDVDPVAPGSRSRPSSRSAGSRSSLRIAEPVTPRHTNASSPIAGAGAGRPSAAGRRCGCASGTTSPGSRARSSEAVVAHHLGDVDQLERPAVVRVTEAVPARHEHVLDQQVPLGSRTRFSRTAYVAPWESRGSSSGSSSASPARSSHGRARTASSRACRARRVTVALRARPAQSVLRQAIDMPWPRRKLPARLEKAARLEAHEDRIERSAREPGSPGELVPVALGGRVGRELSQHSEGLVGMTSHLISLHM